MKFNIDFWIHIVVSIFVLTIIVTTIILTKREMNTQQGMIDMLVYMLEKEQGCPLTEAQHEAVEEKVRDMMKQDPKKVQQQLDYLRENRYGHEAV